MSPLGDPGLAARAGCGRRFEFGLLGPLTVTYDGAPVQVKAARQRALLASLLVDANQIVPADELIARVWRTGSTENARANLHTYVMRLRRVLAGGGAPVPIMTRPEGYLIEVPDDALDLYRFDVLVDEAKTAEPARASALLDEALTLWSGAPLSDVSSEFLHREIVPGLAERRPLALEAYVDAELALGRHHDLLVRLRDLTARHPLRERFWTQRMIALYRCGRQAEALECFRTVGALLAEELGVEPGAELQELHQAILAGDPRLATPAPRVRFRRDDLPGEVPGFTGRWAETRRLVTAIDEAGPDAAVVVLAIDGMAGVGKTALAVRLAHRFAGRHPDARLFLDLHGHTAGREPVDPAEALDVLLRAVGVPGERIPERAEERAAMWRDELAGRRALIVLDNAAGAAQVRPLLPGGGGCLVLVTSRRRLADLDASETLSLDVLPPGDATTLFAGLVGEARADAETDAVADVAEACGYLPPAIRAAAGRLRGRPAWTIGHLARRLREHRPRLDALTPSYEHLTPDGRDLFRLLGVLPGAGVDACLAAAVAGIGLDRADRLLENLVDVHLLEQPAPGRYRLHDLVRGFACATARATLPDASRREAAGRMLDYYLHVAGLADRHFGAGRPTPARPPAHVPPIADQSAALAWCDEEYANLVGAVAYAAAHGWDEHAWRLPHSLWRFFSIRHHVEDWIATHRLALAAADRRGDRTAQARTLSSLAVAYLRVGRHDDAAGHLRRALAHFREAGDRWGEAECRSHLGHVLGRLGRHDEAAGLIHRSLAYFREAGDGWGEAGALNELGAVLRELGRHDEAAGLHRRAVVRTREIGDRWGEARSLGGLGAAVAGLGRYDEAAGHHRHALALFRAIGNAWYEARSLDDLAAAYRGRGDHERAVTLHREALALIRTLGDRDAENVILAGLAETSRRAARHVRGAAADPSHGVVPC
ncbi:BTAD domain-containing putative transcriptional regulator [Actinomadura sp. DC4]|uniref:AfsR/SARP family transcriptional regulator n=1 Tax=Actinomadura sp. DC4 TaxID=3055069 RepID=UPI0025AEDEB8|nr:BTAD domain-containing putative transcriptional regulator [Actinomadura sp. DC4]MDN3354459.1 BTAD domain-containing putative transcriptional regulator [Actinomadura sp. DC4]